jgi:hypothetical protein
VPSVSVFAPIDTAPDGLVTRRPSTDVLVERVVARLEVEVASKTTVSVEVGTPVFQLLAVPQLASVAPVQVWAAPAGRHAIRVESTIPKAMQRCQGDTTAHRLMRSSLPNPSFQPNRHVTLDVQRGGAVSE